MAPNGTQPVPAVLLGPGRAPPGLGLGVRLSGHDSPAFAPNGTQPVPAVLLGPGRAPPGLGLGVRLSGHDSPAFAPNVLNLLADMGVQGGDFDRIEALLDDMLAHQEPSGRIPSYGVAPGGSEPVWGSLLCDSHPILEVLLRFGREQDPRVQYGLTRMASDLTAAQGRPWPCLPHSVSGWRGSRSQV